MAVKKYQILQKISDTETLTLHPETDASIVQVDSTAAGVNASNVQDALKEVNDNIKAITGGGVVTGVKGDAETEYRLGNVNITKANIGLSNVENTSDADKPVSTAQKAALDLKADKTYVDTELANKASTSALNELTNVVATKADKDTVNQSLANKADNSTVTAIDSRVTTVEGKVSTLEETITGLSGAMHFRGSVTSDPLTTTPTLDPAAASGDVVLYDGKEYIYDGSAWALFGDEGSYLTKTTYAADKTAQNEKDTEQDTAIANAASAAGNAQSLADTARSMASSNADAISAMTHDGSGNASTGSVYSADKLSTARKISVAGDVAGEASFDGTADVTINATLANSGITAGDYSCIHVNEKGIATAGGQFIEVGATTSSTPSSSLCVGGLFFKMLG